MPELADSDPPEFLKYVNTRVTLDMLETGDLIQELMDRGRLSVMTVYRKVDSKLYKRPLFYNALWTLLKKDLADKLTNANVMDCAQHNTKTGTIQFSSTIIVLTAQKQENPL